MKDIIIIGAGPAGMSAAIYAQRFGMKSVVIDKQLGGAMVENPEIENYPGMPGKSGMDIATAMQSQAENLGAEFISQSVKNIKLNNDKTFTITTDWDSELQTKTVIIATGLKKRILGAENEEKFKGKGVSYCATCDGAFFKDKKVVVVGGSDSAAVAAFILSKFAKEVHIVYRQAKFFRMNASYIKKLETTNNIKTIFNDEVIKVNGTQTVESLKLKSGKILEAQGLFVEIGHDPQIPFETENFKITLDDKKFIKVDSGQSTNTSGLFAAGDITTNSDGMRQIVTAASEGAIAVASAHKYWLGE